MLVNFRGGVRLLLPFLLIPALAACDKKEEQHEDDPREQTEPTILEVYGRTSCWVVGEELTLDVKCDAKWSASLEGADWLSVKSQTQLTDDMGELVLQVGTNRNATDRSATIVVKSGSKSVSHTLEQQGLDRLFTPKEIYLTGTAESTLSFYAPLKWTATVAEGQEWLEVKTPEGKTGQAKVLVAAKDPNENVGDRSGSLTVTIGTEAFSVPVKQNQTDVLLADNTEISCKYKGGEFRIITQSNVNYKVDIDVNWIHHVETKALNEATECFTVDANGTTSERRASLRFTPKEGMAKSVAVTVVQKGKDPFLFFTMPGFYNIDGQSYTHGSKGWNLSSSVQLADGTAEYRLLNANGLSVLCVRGFDPDAEEESTANLSVVGWVKANKFLIRNYDVTVLGADEEILWLKTSGTTGFIIQK